MHRQERKFRCHHFVRQSEVDWGMLGKEEMHTYIYINKCIYAVIGRIVDTIFIQLVQLVVHLMLYSSLMMLVCIFLPILLLFMVRNACVYWLCVSLNVTRTTVYPGLLHKFSRYQSRYLTHLWVWGRVTGSLPWHPVKGATGIRSRGSCSFVPLWETPPTCWLGKLRLNFNLNGSPLELFFRRKVFSLLVQIQLGFKLKEGGYWEGNETEEEGIRVINFLGIRAITFFFPKHIWTCTSVRELWLIFQRRMKRAIFMLIPNFLLHLLFSEYSLKITCFSQPPAWQEKWAKT